MDSKIQDIQIELATLTAKVGSWMDTTTEYRKSLCVKIGEITEKFNDLPCKERKAWYSGMNRQLAFMWIVITILLGIVVKDGIDRNATVQELKTINMELRSK